MDQASPGGPFNYRLMTSDVKVQPFEVTISLHIVKELCCLVRRYKGEGCSVRESDTTLFLKEIVILREEA